MTWLTRVQGCTLNPLRHDLLFVATERRYEEALRGEGLLPLGEGPDAAELLVTVIQEVVYIHGL